MQEFTGALRAARPFWNSLGQEALLTADAVPSAADVFTDLDLDLGGFDFGVADQAYQVTEFTLDDLGGGGLDLSGPLDFSTTTLDLGW